MLLSSPSVNQGGKLNGGDVIFNGLMGNNNFYRLPLIKDSANS
jgi:hypothetical protein